MINSNPFSSTIRRPIRSKTRQSVLSLHSVSTVSSEEGSGNRAAAAAAAAAAPDGACANIPFAQVRGPAAAAAGPNDERQHL